MEKETPFSEIVKDVMTRLKDYPGGTELFFSRLRLSQQTVSSWRQGRRQATAKGRVQFLEAAAEILKELGSTEIREKKALKDLSELLN